MLNAERSEAHDGVPGFERALGWPVALSWPAIIGAVLLAAVIGLIFGVQPARKAAQLHPVEALRG
jgi:putative ABC transport system permease protein